LADPPVSGLSREAGGVVWRLSGPRRGAAAGGWEGDPGRLPGTENPPIDFPGGFFPSRKMAEPANLPRNSYETAEKP
jgi:hypothetical protein